MKTDRALLILIAGPYLSGTNGDPVLIAANLALLDDTACRTHADPHLRRRNLLRGPLPHLFVFAHLVVRYLGAGHSAPPNFHSSGDHCNPRFRTFPFQILPARLIVAGHPRASCGHIRTRRTMLSPDGSGLGSMYRHQRRYVSRLTDTRRRTKWATAQ